MNIGLLALRLVVGLTFAGHGSQKLFGVLGGPGLRNMASGFERMGLRPGRVHALAAGTTELAGGMLLALGLLTPFAAAGLIAVMTVAVLAVHLPNGFWNSSKGFEYNLALVATAFALAGVGAGDWSLDSALGLAVSGTWWAVAAIAAGVLGGIATLVIGRHYPEHAAHRRQPTAA
jgi:putative oxidoreductase